MAYHGLLDKEKVPVELPNTSIWWINVLNGTFTLHCGWVIVWYTFGVEMAEVDIMLYVFSNIVHSSQAQVLVLWEVSAGGPLTYNFTLKSQIQADLNLVKLNFLSLVKRYDDQTRAGNRQKSTYSSRKLFGNARPSWASIFLFKSSTRRSSCP